MVFGCNCYGRKQGPPEDLPRDRSHEESLFSRLLRSAVQPESVSFTRKKPGEEWDQHVELSRVASSAEKYNVGRTTSVFAWQIDQERSREVSRYDSLAYVTSHGNRLEKRLARLELRQVRMEDDGNCQFRSISKQLYGTQKYHRSVRSVAVNHIRENLDQYEPFLGSHEAATRYLDAMARNRTWGDELTLRACSDAYGVLIHVITSEVDNWYLQYVPQTTKTKKQLYIAYISPIHYNSIVPA